MTLSLPAADASSSLDSVRAKLGRGVAQMFGGVWAEQALNAVTFIVLARMLGAEAFGIGTMALVVIVSAEILLRETITEFLLQKADLDEGHLDAAFWSLLALGAGLTLAVFGGAPWIAALYHAPQVADLLRCACPTLLLVALSGVPVARLRRRLDFQGLAVRSAVGAGAGLAAGIAAALVGAGPASLVVQRLAQGVGADGMVWIGAGWLPGLQAKRRHFAELWRFSARVLGLRMSEVCAQQAPTYLIGLVLGPAALGMFTVAWRLVDTLTFLLIAPVRYVAQPAFAALRGSLPAARALLGEVMRGASLIAFASLFGFAAVCGPVIALAFGPGWGEAAPVAAVLSLVGVYFSIERLHQALFLALGRPGEMLLLSLAQTAAAVVLIAFASPRGLMAVTLAFAAAMALVWPLRLWRLRALLAAPIGGHLRSLAQPLLAAVVMAAAVVVWQRTFGAALPPVLGLTSSAAIGLVVYGVLVWRFAPSSVRTVLAILSGRGTFA